MTDEFCMIRPTKNSISFGLLKKAKVEAIRTTIFFDFQIILGLPDGL